MPDVWARFLELPPDGVVDLLITPHRNHRSLQVAETLQQVAVKEGILRENAAEDSPRRGLFVRGQSAIAVRLTLEELIVCVLPFSRWWERSIRPALDKGAVLKDHPEFAWLLHAGDMLDLKRRKARSLFARAEKARLETRLAETNLIFKVACNRGAKLALDSSVRTIKADAARQLFNVQGAGVRWAVVDSGVDSRHAAFLLPPDDEEGEGAESASRVSASYDFVRVRELMELSSSPLAKDRERLKNEFNLSSAEADQLKEAIRTSVDVPWGPIADRLLVRDADEYRAKIEAHGTHVAGILGAGAGAEEAGAMGVCPDIEILDLRVLDENGAGDEFSILAALQYIRHVNDQSADSKIHGANLSFSIPFDPKFYACGATPICQECDRLTASGVVTVAAAGNLGAEASDSRSVMIGSAYRAQTITDPGNARSVITVGSTHGRRPHEYGVSYFSSRGPTGDGRAKPDLVAPGEKIRSAIPGGGYDGKQGTSMAAPHVSGAAALLMARNRELIGKPERIKRILCETATDLERERYFQGCGLVDILRALQSV